jgi:hypothetical protein
LGRLIGVLCKSINILMNFLSKILKKNSIPQAGLVHLQ